MENMEVKHPGWDVDSVKGTDGYLWDSIDQQFSAPKTFEESFPGRREKVKQWHDYARDMDLNRADPRRGILLGELKNNLGCLMCKEGEPCLLHLHHLHHGEGKVGSVSGMYRTRPWSEVCDEAAKCDVLCGNDHMFATLKLQPYLQISKGKEKEPKIVTPMFGAKRRHMIEKMETFNGKWTGRTMLRTIPPGSTLKILNVEPHELRQRDIIWCSINGFSYCHFVKSIRGNDSRLDKIQCEVASESGRVQGLTDIIWGKVIKINGIKYERQ